MLELITRFSYSEHWKRQRCGEIETQKQKQTRMDLFLVQPNREGTHQKRTMQYH